MPRLLACHSATGHASIYAECHCMAIFAHYDHTMPLLQSLQWLPMPVGIVFSLAVRIYCCLHGTAPDNLVSELHPLSSVDAWQTAMIDDCCCPHQTARVWHGLMDGHVLSHLHVWNNTLEFVQSSPVPNISCLWLKTYEQYQWKVIRLVGTQQEVGITTTCSFLNWLSLPWLLQARMAVQRRTPGNNWSRLFMARCHSWHPDDSVKNANEGNSPTGLILSLSTNCFLMEGTHQVCDASECQSPGVLVGEVPSLPTTTFNRQ